MTQLTKRSTIYFSPEIHKTLKLKSVETSRSVSDLVHEALLLKLSEDFEDLMAFKDRKNEKTLSFDTMIDKLKADGKI